jgi:hypothetical protein
MATETGVGTALLMIPVIVVLSASVGLEVAVDGVEARRRARLGRAPFVYVGPFQWWTWDRKRMWVVTVQKGA